MSDNENAIVSLNSPKEADEILKMISNGQNVALDVDKEQLINNFNTFMLSEAYSQIPTLIRLHELQTKCLNEYYKQVEELLENEDANVFLLEKIIGTINGTIDRCNNIIMKLGLNANITDQLIINNIDNSQNVNVFQSQMSQQKVVDLLNRVKNGEFNDINLIDNK